MALTTVNSDGVKDDSIKNIDVKSDAAIAGTKIAPDFGSQDITSSGKINIGSSTHTTRKLAIHDTTNAAIVIEGASDGSSSILLADENDEDVGFITYNHVTNDLTLTAADNIILTGDAVGINKTSPSSALDVNGEISLPFNNTLRWLESDGTVASDMYTNGSNTLIFRNNSGGETANLDTSGNLELAGNLKLAATKGINFSNYGSEDDSALTGIYDNLLDDYEAGLWYPTLSNGTATWYNARYIKIGKLVQIWGRFAAPTDVTSNTIVSVESLPFAVETNNAGGSCMCKHVNVDATCAYVTDLEQLQFYGNNTANTWTYLKSNGMNAANTNVYFQASYRAVA